MVAGTLSLLVPGLGHLVIGAHRRAAVLLALTLAIVLAAGATVFARPALGLRLLVVLLLLDVALFALRAFAVVDAGRSAGPAFLAMLLAVAVAPHVAVSYVAVRSYAVANRVFAHAQPRDVLPSR